MCINGDADITSTQELVPKELGVEVQAPKFKGPITRSRAYALKNKFIEYVMRAIDADITSITSLEPEVPGMVQSPAIKGSITRSRSRALKDKFTEYIKKTVLFEESKTGPTTTEVPASKTSHQKAKALALKTGHQTAEAPASKTSSRCTSVQDRPFNGRDRSNKDPEPFDQDQERTVQG